MSTRINGLRYQFRVFASSKPWLFFSLYRLSRGNDQLMVRPETELVIEGFPRSANTFAVVAFESAQRRKVKIAHHLHAQAQVIRAARFGIPTCVLIREPSDAIRSLLVRHRHISWRVALTHYLEFYGDIFDLRTRFVIAPFQQVIEEFGAVIRRINQRFDTQFSEFVGTSEATERVMADVDQINKRLDRENEKALARPSPIREELKQAVPDPDDDHEIDMLNRARQLFRKYVED